MITKKCRILSKFKTPLPLQGALGIKFVFPYLDDRELEKRDVRILDADKGLVEFTLTDFEVQGLKTGEMQNFKAEVMFQSHKEIVIFQKAMTIVVEDERKVWK